MVRPFQSGELDARSAGKPHERKRRSGVSIDAGSKKYNGHPGLTRMMQGLPRNTAVQKRVAGYARVSTDSEEQQTSYEARGGLLHELYSVKHGVGVCQGLYRRGHLGLNTKKHRDGFNEMIQDALDGELTLSLQESNP